MFITLTGILPRKKSIESKTQDLENDFEVIKQGKSDLHFFLVSKKMASGFLVRCMFETDTCSDKSVGQSHNDYEDMVNRRS